jgi:Protein of unknown function (DUF2846)
LKRRRTVALVTIAVGALAGCASTPSGEAFSRLVEPRADGALLYLYRPDEYYGKGLAFTVLVDGEEKGNIGNGGYMIIPLATGKRVIAVKGLGYKDEPHEMEARNGGIDFLRVATKKGFGGFSATLVLEAEVEAKAVADLGNLKREPERYLDEGI